MDADELNQARWARIFRLSVVQVMAQTGCDAEEALDRYIETLRKGGIVRVEGENVIVPEISEEQMEAALRALREGNN
jgi:signal transduction histidine kinase